MRFFFDVSEAGQITEDLVGTELAGRDNVAGEARRLALDIARDLRGVGDDFLIEVFVSDEGRQHVLAHSMLLRTIWAA